MGAPLPAAPPCIRHRRFPRTTGDWHSFPARVRAPQRAARLVDDFLSCTGLLFEFLGSASGGDGTDDCLATGIDGNVLDSNPLPTFAAVTIEGFNQSREGPRELIRLVQALAPTGEGLLTKHRASIAFHGGVMARDRLSDRHSLDRVARLQLMHSGEYRTRQALIRVGVPRRASSNDLTNQVQSEIMVVRAADRPQRRALLSGSRDVDYLAGLLGPRRRSSSLSFSSPLCSRSRA